MAASENSAPGAQRELSNEVPQDENPDLESLTVPAVMAWVNQKRGDERAARLDRVMAIVRPDGPDARPND